MSIIVNGWLKPTLEISVSEGGSLLANTKYYVCGVMKYTPFAYSSVGSCLSDVYEITTTTTAKAIVITQKTYRNITNFDASNGKTLCTSNRHCLKTADVLKIIDSSYAGSWPITKIDYNNFTIDCSYINNVDASSYTDSVHYNTPPYVGPGGYSAITKGMSYYVHDGNPLEDGSTWTGGDRWTSTPFDTYNLTNPTVVSAQLTRNFSTGCPDLTVRKCNNGIYSPFNGNYGTIMVTVTENHTLQEIYDAVQASGFKYSCSYNSDQNNFMLVGTLYFTSNGTNGNTSTATLTLNGTNFTIVNGEVYTAVPSNVIFNNCLINTLPKLSQNSFLFGANDCLMFNNKSGAGGVSFRYWLSGNNNVIMAPVYPTSNMCDIPNLKLTNILDGTLRDYGIIQNKTFKAADPAGFFQNAYNQIQIKNCNIFTIYWILPNEANDFETNIYMMENCYINTGISNYQYRFYAYAAKQPYKDKLKFLNINTDASDNVKRCVHSTILNVEADFYRRGEFWIQDTSGNAINGASISIIDNYLNTYSNTTDASGYAIIDVLEQKTTFDSSMSAISFWNPIYDKYYNNYEITISKPGYISDTLNVSTFYDSGNYSKVFNVALIPSKEISIVF